MAQQNVSFTQLVCTVASQAGLNVTVDNDTRVTVPFDMGDGRHQNVWIIPMCEDAGGNQVICICSPALQMNKGQMLSQQVANDLLKANAITAHAAWGLIETPENDFLIAFSTQIAHTMDPDEFNAAVRTVACVSDEMEKRLGVDVF